MAYFRKHRDGWRAEIERKGHPRQSQVFRTLTAAKAWATRIESAIIDGTASRWPAKTLQEAMTRYATTVSPAKRGGAKEALRFAALARDFPELAGKILHEITPADLAAWRDARLAVVSSASVLRDINLLRNVWTKASREWGWCEDSPWRKIDMPSGGAARTRIAGWRELRRLLRRLGYEVGRPPQTVLERVAWAVLVAARTGLRAGEVVGLRVGDIAGGVATIPQHKTQHLTGKPRRVPLTHRGLALLSALEENARRAGRSSLLGLSATSLDANWRKACASVLIEDLHYHDLRATFATHMARRVDVLTLAKILGHKDVKQTMVYYRESEEAIGARLREGVAWRTRQ